MSWYQRSNLAIVIFDMADGSGGRAAEIWAFRHPETVVVDIEQLYDYNDCSIREPPIGHRGKVVVEGRDPKGIHVANAEDLANAVRNHWGAFTAEQTAIGSRKGISRG